MIRLFAPQLTSPVGGEVFNLGKVTITWDVNNPPTDDPYESVDTAVISYEIEYTDDYKYDQTNWHTIKRRIPWVENSYEWMTGKMIKSSSVRLRIRSKNSLDGSVSDWSMSSGDFSVNVFKLIPPAIVSPSSNQIYTDFILIILDETLTRNTFNQKVRYTLEYASEKRGISWTTIVKNVPVGKNVIRWDLDDVPPSDDYVLRLTAKNSATSCLQTSEPTPDQIVKRFVYNIKIQQPGMFIIDTKPPQGILDIEGSSGITNELIHTLTVFAEDDISGVKQIQLRECDTSNQLALGDVSNDNFGEITECPTVAELITPESDFDKLIGKPMGYSTKIQWVLDDKSGLRRIEALLTDYGGNSSIQETNKSFVPIFRNDAEINDIIVTIEQRNNTIIEEDGQGNPQITEKVSIFESAYLSTADGEYWALDPFPRLIARSVFNRDVKRLFAYDGLVYLLTYTNNSSIVDRGTIFKDNKFQLVNIYTFPNPSSEPNAVAEFQNVMYIGLENGELWSYDGSSFESIITFSNPIRTLYGDNNYLYIGLSNSSLISLYNGTGFFTSDIGS